MGMRFGKWTVLETFSNNNKGRVICQCECGRIREVDTYSLTHSGTKSCGSCNTIIDEGEFMRCITANGSSFLFSHEDLSKVESHTWRISRGYVTATINGRTVYLHKYLMDADSATQVDHISRDRLDNRRPNLRFANHAQNQWNKDVRRDSTTGYTGVCFDKRSNKYIAYINANKNREYLGYYSVAEDAALAYNEAAVRLHGEFACLNQIKGGYD